MSKTSLLFEKQSTGGVVARGGFEYQDAYLLQHFPRFLSQSAFSHAVSELLGDIEIRYHRPQGGTFCVAYELKKNQLTSTEFWSEITRFAQLYQGAPQEYVRFVLVCSDFVSTVQPLLRMLERYRGTAAALNSDSAVLAAGEAEINQTIGDLGWTAATARFVRERVWFETYDASGVDGGFAAGLTEHLPQMNEMRGSEVVAFRTRCKALVEQSVRGVVHRRDLEAALVDSAPALAAAWIATPTSLQLLPGPSSAVEHLWLDVGKYNGDERGRLGPQAWTDLQGELARTGAFILDSRSRRGVDLSAKQRMSLAQTVGFCFSATRGFTLRMEHNSGAFDTSIHGRAVGSFFAPAELVAGSGSEGVVYLGFPYGGRDPVVAAAASLGLAGAPQLHLESASVVTDTVDLNLAVHEAKAALVEFRAVHQLQKLHLFVRAPSHFAMALGYRLNSLGTIQLYDWVDTAYMPTATLS